MDHVTGTLQAAHEAYERREWAAARAGFLRGREHGDLHPDDLAALADAAWWLGLTDESLKTSEEAFQRYHTAGQMCRGARLALEIGFLSLLRGDVAVGSGWISRAARLLQEEPGCVEHAILEYVAFNEALGRGDLDRARTCVQRMQEIGREHSDRTVEAIGLACRGVTLIKEGVVEAGLGSLDEALLAVTTGQVTPDWAGNIYCQMMQVCHEVADVRRAREWTAATERWCAGFDSAVMFVGICRVHRAQLLVLEGAWAEAEQEATRAAEDLQGMNVGAQAEAHYLLAEVRRLRGDESGAEEAYGRAHALGRDPQPGLALLRLSQDRGDAAEAALRAALVAAANEPFVRARLCAARIDVALDRDDLYTAQDALEELEQLAGGYDGGALQAAVRQAQGAVRLAEGAPEKAAPALRDALHRWQDLTAPYDVAKVRVLLARVATALGDDDGAARELAVADATFAVLGARPDRDRTAALSGRSSRPGGLTGREVEVLSCLAAGHRNREIADTLNISEKTVARHLSNIFVKLGVSSRTQATAYAYDHGLVRQTRGRG